MIGQPCLPHYFLSLFLNFFLWILHVIHYLCVCVGIWCYVWLILFWLCTPGLPAGFPVPRWGQGIPWFHAPPPMLTSWPVGGSLAPSSDVTYDIPNVLTLCGSDVTMLGISRAVTLPFPLLLESSLLPLPGYQQKKNSMTLLLQSFLERTDVASGFYYFEDIMGKWKPER